MPRRNRGYTKEWRPDRKVWEIIWYERGKRKRLSTRTADSAEADQILIAHIERSRRRAKTRLVDDILADYQLEHAPHVAAPKFIGWVVQNLEPFFADLGFEEVTKSKCQEYVAERRKNKPGVSDNTLRGELAILQAALNHDYKNGRIPSAPSVWMPSKPPSKERWLSRKEAAKLLRAARKKTWHLPWFILISLYSGQRKGAVLNLTWDRVNLETGKIDWQYGRSTNKKRPRQPMPDELWLFLKYLRKHGTENGPVLHKDGRPMADIKHSMATAVKDAKLKDVTPHTLKHTAITWMLQNGTDLWSVAGFTGTSVSTIEKTYGHHAEDYMEEARSSSKRARAKRRFTAPEAAPKDKREMGKTT